MKDQVLSIEQMKKLKELGIDDNKAKIYWVNQVNGTSINEPINGESFLRLNKGEKFMHTGFMRFETIPTFTLQDMIELMPNNVIKDNTEFYLIIDKSTIGYIDITEEYLVHKSYNGLLNNAFNMLVWLAENKYI